MQRSPLFSKFFVAFAGAFLFICPLQAEPLNLDLLRKTVEKYHDSGVYGREINAIAQQANRLINQRVLSNQRLTHPKKLAIVLDIDETSLSNYAHMRSRSFIGTHAQLIKEIHAADAPPIKPILSLYQNALKHHVGVFFVTGRKEPERKATVINLRKAGFNHWEGIYFKPSHYIFKSVIPFKSGIRSKITHRGYTIIASIGDQCSDLKGGYAEAGFKLPNPYYYLP